MQVFFKRLDKAETMLAELSWACCGKLACLPCIWCSRPHLSHPGVCPLTTQGIQGPLWDFPLLYLQTNSICHRVPEQPRKTDVLPLAWWEAPGSQERALAVLLSFEDRSFTGTVINVLTPKKVKTRLFLHLTWAPPLASCWLTSVLTHLPTEGP